MKKTISELKGVKMLTKEQQKSIAGSIAMPKIPCGYICLPWCNTGCPQ